MTTKTIRIPFGVLPTGVRTTVPFRTLESAVEDIKRLYPDEAEQKTCMVTVTVDACVIAHALSPAEQVVDLQTQLEQAQAVIRELRQQLDPQTGSDTPGTPAPTPGPAEPSAPLPPARAPTDDENRAAMFDWAGRTLFKYPQDVKMYARWLSENGHSQADLERWLRLPPGDVARELAERGG